MNQTNNITSIKLNSGEVWILDLPPELRNVIYDLCLIYSKHVQIERADWHGFSNVPKIYASMPYPSEPKRFNTNLLLTSKLIHAEATPVLYGSNFFDLRRCASKLFLSSIETSLRHLRSVKLSSEKKQCDLKAAFEMLKDCKCLDEVVIGDSCDKNFRKPDTISKALGPLVVKLHNERKGSDKKGALEVVQFEGLEAHHYYASFNYAVKATKLLEEMLEREDGNNEGE